MNTSLSASSRVEDFWAMIGRLKKEIEETRNTKPEPREKGSAFIWEGKRRQLKDDLLALADLAFEKAGMANENGDGNDYLDLGEIVRQIDSLLQAEWSAVLDLEEVFPEWTNFRTA